MSPHWVAARPHVSPRAARLGLFSAAASLALLVSLAACAPEDAKRTSKRGSATEAGTSDGAAMPSFTVSPSTRITVTWILPSITMLSPIFRDRMSITG